MTASEDLGQTAELLCREPWESYYILRRGILPCCHGATPIAPMSEWEAAWNSPELQEIRSHLAKGRLSPYCLSSLGCPVVQRYLEEKRRSPYGALLPAARPMFLRRINRFFRGVPARVYRAVASR